MPPSLDSCIGSGLDAFRLDATSTASTTHSTTAAGPTQAAHRPRAPAVLSLPAILSSLTGRKAQALAAPRFPPPGGERRFTVSTDADEVIHRGARVNAIERRVPPAHRLTMATPICRQAQRAFGAPLQAGSLQACTLDARVDLHGHGTASTFSALDAPGLAAALHAAGLRQVGILKLQSCHAGAGRYLEDLRRELSARGVQVGYLCGPMGRIGDQREFGEENGREFIRFCAFLPGLRKTVEWLPETYGLRVVKGNVDVRFPGTRYDRRM